MNLIPYYLIAGFFCWARVTFLTDKDKEFINEHLGMSIYENNKSQLQIAALLLGGLVLPLALILSIMELFNEK